MGPKGVPPGPADTETLMVPCFASATPEQSPRRCTAYSMQHEHACALPLQDEQDRGSCVTAATAQTAVYSLASSQQALQLGPAEAAAVGEECSVGGLVQHGNELYGDQVRGDPVRQGVGWLPGYDGMAARCVPPMRCFTIHELAASPPPRRMHARLCAQPQPRRSARTRCRRW